MPQVTARELVRFLRAQGFAEDRQSGTHLTLWCIKRCCVDGRWARKARPPAGSWGGISYKACGFRIKEKAHRFIVENQISKADPSLRSGW